ncbi:MAG: hypothetical protein Q9227_003515 [Pyrenula ochraceoflavens]
MSRPLPALSRKTSEAWDRLRPLKQDTLDSMGYISRAQESYYNKIVARYMQFCTSHAKGLENAFASLSINDDHSASSDPARNPPTAPSFLQKTGTSAPSPPKVDRPSSPTKPSVPSQQQSDPSSELSTILTALRKLREALLANPASIVFSQRVHVFGIRLAILALHPPSYYPALLHLLFKLHTPNAPLPSPELSEMATYLILDLACRQRAFTSAYALRARSKAMFGYQSLYVDMILKAVVTDNWVAFWKVRRKVDGYIRAVMSWAAPEIGRVALKAIGRSYLACDRDWILESAAGGQLEWKELVERESVGWILGEDGKTVTIRKVKPKGKS